jgi:hypothetical protein
MKIIRREFLCLSGITVAAPASRLNFQEHLLAGTATGHTAEHAHELL